jgi:ectoine hydroxylase-related dioxygenase (phytanoyl-CoA dioxygenase family)
MPIEPLSFAEHGAAIQRNALSLAQLRSVETTVADLPHGQAGIRLHGIEPLRSLLCASGPVGQLAATVLGPQCRPVRAILFDKTAAANWSLPWHQDRTIAVCERRDVAGYGPWSRKAGMIHVEPPADVLAGMVTLRVHLDPVPETNAPLLIAPGSHQFGRIPESAIGDVVARCGVVACVALPGDVWLYATLILHASAAAVEPSHRRVLQVDFSAGDLPGGLAWLGV